MDILKIVFLAVVQGLTEFLPVSSSGHLVIFEHLLHVKQPGLILEVALHLGTVLAVLAVYRRDIAPLVRDSVRALHKRDWQTNPNARFVLAIVIASAPTAIIGLALKKCVEGMFQGLLGIGIALIVTAAILWLTRLAGKSSSDANEIGLLRAALIGVAQGIAVTPGISRSGATISCGLLLGVERETAARFSFLLSIPAILGAAVLELRDAAGKQIDWLPILAGVIVSFLVGCLALKMLLRLVKRGRLHLFSCYCFPVGALTILAWMLYN